MTYWAEGILLGLLLLVNRMLFGDRVVLFDLDLALNRLLVLGRIIGVALADALAVAVRDELYEMLL